MSRICRRDVLARGVGLAGAGLVLPAALARTTNTHAVRFGIIADPHHGLAPDADTRLDAFASACERRNDLDFVIQLGDFCHPTDEARAFVERFDAIGLERHHVLGNHDMDKGTKAQTIRHWSMNDRHYAFVQQGIRFVILDLNHIREGEKRVSYSNANFYIDADQRTWIDLDQLAWLRRTLQGEDLPTIIFSHQPLGIAKPGQPLPPQQIEVLDVLSEQRAGSPILACMCGHLHVDRIERVRGMHCLCINSASYLWHRGMLPYRDPLFAFVTIQPNGTTLIEGRSTEFRDGHPHEQGLAQDMLGVAAKISDRRLRS